MKLLDYRQFESYFEPPESPVWFIETYENLIQNFEIRLQKELNFSAEHWFEDMIELDKEAEFDMEAEALVGEWYRKLYVGKFNSTIDDHEVTPEYRRVEKEVSQLIAKPGENTKVTMRTAYNEKKKKLNEALVKNAIEKHWSEWKAFYQKWIDFVNSKRGFLAGKKFGL